MKIPQGLIAKNSTNESVDISEPRPLKRTP